MHLPGKRLHVTVYIADSMTLATCARRNDRQRVKREGIAQQRSGGSCMSAWFSYVHAPNVHTGARTHKDFHRPGHVLLLSWPRGQRLALQHAGC